MSELRQDRTTGAWSIIAPNRGKRPHDHSPSEEPVDPGNDDCPFCPGHEAVLPSITSQIAQEAWPGWRVRAVPNLYPALGPENPVHPEEPPDAEPVAGHRREPGEGRHEVIIDSPDHDADIAGFDDAQIAALMKMYHQRYVALAALPRTETVVLCRNHGHMAGASLRHPHTQVLALATVPQRIRSVINWCRSAYRRTGHCPTCLELAAEMRDGSRIVEVMDRFVALVPYAASGPCETWIIPRRHQASFVAVEALDLLALGQILRRSTRRMKTALGNSAAYNLVIDSAPERGSVGAFFHWKLRLVPAMVVKGGFELGTDLPINPSSPEADAKALRQA